MNFEAQVNVVYIYIFEMDIMSLYVIFFYPQTGLLLEVSPSKNYLFLGNDQHFSKKPKCKTSFSHRRTLKETDCIGGSESNYN